MVPRLLVQEDGVILSQVHNFPPGMSWRFADFVSPSKEAEKEGCAMEVVAKHSLLSNVFAGMSEKVAYG